MIKRVVLMSLIFLSIQNSKAMDDLKDQVEVFGELNSEGAVIMDQVRFTVIAYRNLFKKNPSERDRLKELNKESIKLYKESRDVLDRAVLSCKHNESIEELKDITHRKQVLNKEFKENLERMQQDMAARIKIDLPEQKK
jgi:hypothetical protein